MFIGPQDGFNAAVQAATSEVDIFWCEAESRAVSRNLDGVHALVDASMQVRVSAALLAGAQSLEVISTATTGSDHIEQEVLRERGIALYTLREDKEFMRNITPAAEHSWMLLMALAGQLIPALVSVKAGMWEREDYPSVMLRGKTLGLVGCGRIGQWMARYGQAFGMTIIGHDPYVAPWPSEIRSVSLDKVFETSDFISVHVHLSKETTGLIDENLFLKMKPGSIIINTSRGGVIDEQALLEALKCDRLAGAGLDVLQGEPDIENHPLVEYSRRERNLLITPHCAGYSYDAVRIVCQKATEKVIKYFRGNQS
jgi:D-3-phosphoglycerate dehydrogenase